MKKIYLSIALFVPLFFAGCSKDFLVRPPLNQIPQESFWKTEQDAVFATNAIYDALQMDLGYRLGTMMFGDVAGDDMNCFDPNWFVKMDNFTINTSDPQILSSWRAWWAGVTRANAVIAHVPGISMNEELKTRLVNEAKFLRGVCYFNIVTIWGDAPLILTELSQDELFSVTRQPQAAIWQQIEKDFSDAEALPLQYGSSDAGRATKGAAKAFLARTYLYQKKFEAAAAKAKEVIDLGVYHLHDEYIKNFQTAYENGVESVFEVQFVSGTGGWGPNEGNWAPSYTGPAGPYVPSGAWGIIVPEVNHTKIYEPGDKRRAVNIFEAGSVYNNVPYDPKWSTTGTSLAKYIVGDPPVASEGMVDGARNMPVIRYAEVMLIYAEAINETGQTNLALPYVDSVRTRAGLPVLTKLNKETMRDAILQERRVEFFGEGQRFFDLRRTGRADACIRVKANKPNYTEPKNLYFPIPQNEIDLNKALTQNPGY